MLKKYIIIIFICIFYLIFFYINELSFASEIPVDIKNSSIKWSKLNLNIYVEDNSEMIKNLFIDWNDKSGKIFSFEFVNNKLNADIAVLYTDEDLSSYGAYTTYFHSNDEILKVVINLPKKTFSNNRENNPINMFVIKHEIGHSLGLFKHSNNKKDIMYHIKTKENIDISPHDIKRLKTNH